MAARDRSACHRGGMHRRKPRCRCMSDRHSRNGGDSRRGLAGYRARSQKSSRFLPRSSSRMGSFLQSYRCGHPLLIDLTYLAIKAPVIGVETHAVVNDASVLPAHGKAVGEQRTPILCPQCIGRAIDLLLAKDGAVWSAADEGYRIVVAGDWRAWRAPEERLRVNRLLLKNSTRSSNC